MPKRPAQHVIDWHLTRVKARYLLTRRAGARVARTKPELETAVALNSALRTGAPRVSGSEAGATRVLICDGNHEVCAGPVG